MQDTLAFTPAQEVRRIPALTDTGDARLLAALPADAAPADWTWSVSVTQLTRDATLAPQPDIDRILLLAEGALVLQRLDTGEEKPLETGARLYFAGETPFVARPIEGPACTFDLMFARKQAHGCVDIRSSHQNLPLRAGETLLFGLQGHFRLALPARMGGERVLGPGDVLQLTLDYVPATALEITPLDPDARLIDARINLFPGLS